MGMMLFVRKQYDGQAHDLEVRDDLVFQRPHRELDTVDPVRKCCFPPSLKICLYILLRLVTHDDVKWRHYLHNMTLTGARR